MYPPPNSKRYFSSLSRWLPAKSRPVTSTLIVAAIALALLIGLAVLLPIMVMGITRLESNTGAGTVPASNGQVLANGLPTINEWQPSKAKKDPVDAPMVANAGQRSQKPHTATELPSKHPRTHKIPEHHKVDNTAAPSNAASEDAGDWADKAAAIKAAFVHAYSQYEKKCFGEDEYRPLSGQCHNWMGAGLTIIDAMPTMHVMGLTDQFARAAEYVNTRLTFNSNMMTSFFETTIRVLGGLVSAYDLSNDQGLLDKAKLMADKLMPVFNTPTGIPLAQINLATGQSAPLSWTGGASLLAELGTCQMEFFSVSSRTGVDKYWKAAQKPIDTIEQTRPHIPGLYPIYISPQSGQFTNNRVAWGAMGDSFYEYLLKMYLLTGKQHEQYKRMYIQSIDAMFSHLYSNTPSGVAYIADLENGNKDHKMDHLVCFAPGMLALGVAHGVVEGDEAKRHLDAARELTATCRTMYSNSPSGIGAEYSRFTPEMTPGHDASYKLRPETVEALLMLYRVTGDEKYREWGWEIWQSIDKHCRVAGGYAALVDVRFPQQHEDKMESFFLAETLKYLYLLFSDRSLIPIVPAHAKDGKTFYVFNTEAHPIRAWSSWPLEK